MKRRILWGSIAVVALVAAIALVARSRSSGDKNANIRMARAEYADLVVSSTASGTVQADEQVDVKSRASGEVVALLVQAGDTVRAGDLLVRLDPVDEERLVAQTEADAASARAHVALARAALDAAKADVADAASHADRRRAAHDAGLVSAEEYATARTAADVARHAVTQREADLQSALSSDEKARLAVANERKRLAETILRAPIDGTVLSVAAQKGSIVSSGITNVGGGTALITLADLAKLYVIVKLDEAGIGSVRESQPALIRVDAWPEHEFRGIVERITPLGVAVSNVVTFDVKVRVEDDSASLLFPGMSADVEIISARIPHALTIPQGALRSDREHHGERYVLMPDERRRTVRAGATDGTRVEILDGLSEGEVIIAAGGAPAKPADQPSFFRIFSGGRRNR